MNTDNTTITVQTPVGVGQVFGIDRGVVLIEFDYRYLVAMAPELVERIDEK